MSVQSEHHGSGDVPHRAVTLGGITVLRVEGEVDLGALPIRRLAGAPQGRGGWV
jgi:hypothetical protein